jgi:hypothetical protein
MCWLRLGLKAELLLNPRPGLTVLGLFTRDIYNILIISKIHVVK